MKKYTAQRHGKQFILVGDDVEIGRVAEVKRIFYFRWYIILNSISYEIKNVGFLKNDLKLFNGENVVYFTDLGKDRIIKSGENVRIYYFKLSKTKQLFEKGKLLIEVREEKGMSRDSIFHIEADDTVEDLLILLFFHYSTKEFNSIGGDGD